MDDTIGTIVVTGLLSAIILFALYSQRRVRRLQARVDYLQECVRLMDEKGINGIDLLPAVAAVELKKLRFFASGTADQPRLARITNVVIPHHGYPTSEQWVQLISAQPHEAHLLGGQIRNEVAAEGSAASLHALNSLNGYAAATRFLAESSEGADQPILPTLADLKAAAYPDEQGWRDLLARDPLLAMFTQEAIERQIGYYKFGDAPPAAEASLEVRRRVLSQT